jgi:hypothetical protein
MARLIDLILISAEQGLKLQAQDGSMPPGHNGPRFDKDTPTRNTAHWLISFLWAYKIEGNEKFKEAAKSGAAYLISHSCRPMKAAFWCRTNPEKDLSNGLIGQAWAIEALAIAAKELDNPEFGRVATQTFLLHPFDRRYALWHGINVDGSWLPLNLTFNQQLWFAMAGLLITKNAGSNHQVKERVDTFLKCYDKFLFLNRDGLIHHAIPKMAITQNPVKKSIKYLFDWKHCVTKRYLNTSVGYHAFNLYAFAVLFMETQSDSEVFVVRHRLKRAIAFLRTHRFADTIDNNIYGYCYNPVGLEAALVVSIFSSYLGDNIDIMAEIDKWVNIQFRRHFSPEKGLMVKNTGDPDTLAARIYELTRMPKHILEAIEIDFR